MFFRNSSMSRPNIVCSISLLLISPSAFERRTFMGVDIWLHFGHRQSHRWWHKIKSSMLREKNARVTPPMTIVHQGTSCAHQFLVVWWQSLLRWKPLFISQFLVALNLLLWFNLCQAKIKFWFLGQRKKRMTSFGSCSFFTLSAKPETKTTETTHTVQSAAVLCKFPSHSS